MVLYICFNVLKIRSVTSFIPFSFFQNSSSFIMINLLLPKDAEFESADTKKQTRGSTSTKRSRAAEVHNLSERVSILLKLIYC